MDTLIVVVMDESGSMGDKIGDVIGGFNHFVETQRQLSDTYLSTARLTLVKFNSEVTIAYNAELVSEVPPLDVNSYCPTGRTALYDAIAEGVKLAEETKKESEKVICVIMTDGEENASMETSKEDIKRLIARHESEGDWTFTYIGEEPETWAQDTSMSFGNVAQYNHSNPRLNFEVVSDAVQNFRTSKKPVMRLLNKNLLNIVFV